MTTRIPLNTLAIPLGVAGLAALWSDAVDALGIAWPIDQVLWVVAAVVWVWTIVAHLVRGARSAEGLGTQLIHPVQGPLAALVPVVGMLLGADLHRYVPVAGDALVIVSVVVAALFAGWLIASWLGGRLALESLHGGYLLPTVAAGYVAARAVGELGDRPIAIGLFAVATFFWVVVATLLIARLAFRPALPDPLLPTTAILLAPPGVAAAAWWAIVGLHADDVEYALAGMAVLMVLVQLGLLPRYRRLRFSLGFWSFTFPTAATGALGIVWLDLLRPVGWQAIAIAILAGVTVLTGWIAVRSLLLRRVVPTPTAPLTKADDAISTPTAS